MTKTSEKIYMEIRNLTEKGTEQRLMRVRMEVYSGLLKMLNTMEARMKLEKTFLHTRELSDGITL